MKIHILSDIHNEFSAFEPPHPDADVIVLAGDIDLHTKGVDWAIETWRGADAAIIYVIGNHEFYNAELHGIRQQIKQRAAEARTSGVAIWVLDDDALEFTDPVSGNLVRFLGATLWTDYKLFGNDSMVFAMKNAERWLNDHRIIRCSPHDRFPAIEAAKLNQKSVSWLAGELAKPFDGKTIVVTHHLPSENSVAYRYKTDALSSAFASNLDHLVQKADLWVHGHTHDNFDYQLGKCRVVCNPRGYIRERHHGWEIENRNFIPDLVVEI